MYFLNCFLIYSILGYILETVLGIITKTNYKSGILNGPWAVIYGIGVVVILLLSNYFFKNLHMPRLLETIIVFFILAIFLTCLEALGGILIEKVFTAGDSIYCMGSYDADSSDASYSILFFYRAGKQHRQLLIYSGSLY